MDIKNTFQIPHHNSKSLEEDNNPGIYQFTTTTKRVADPKQQWRWGRIGPHLRAQTTELQVGELQQVLVIAKRTLCVRRLGFQVDRDRVVLIRRRHGVADFRRVCPDLLPGLLVLVCGNTERCVRRTAIFYGVVGKR